ncbi:MAG: PTS lactose/cellobiose transporter subunit IIA [Lacrimispora sp.]|uniref:PTS lactose/cellobiose transporter subunit IIA n=1 Tax=Lacrimispora sp. TaxID=2719234 RepID=UPI0039E63975
MDHIKEEIQLIACQIVAAVGGAKSMYIEAINLVKQGRVEEARGKMKEGRDLYMESHTHHFSLIQKEAGGEDIPFSLILMHAEDQMLSTEIVELMASELIGVYEKMTFSQNVQNQEA